MKKLTIKLTLIILIIALVGTGITWAYSRRDKDTFLTKLLFQTLDFWHYQPVELNDQFSKNAFALFIRNLDYNKKFFLKSDIERLQNYQTKIDDQINDGDTEFMDLAYSILKKRIEDVQNFYPELLNQPFDFTVKESFETKPEKRDYPGNREEMKEVWRKLLKYQTLNVYLEMIQSPEHKANADNLAKDVNPKLEAEARQRVSRTIKSSLLRLLQQSHEDRIELYMNSILACFDPHTDFFPPQRKEDFDINMSGKLEGIGALLREDGEYIKVEQIVVGSAAWRQKELKEGDLILKVAEGDKEPVDVANMPINDVVQLIRGKKGTQVKLTVKKPDGQIQTIAITRDVVIIEESYAKSALIINPKTKKKTGYIVLPSFYHDFNAKFNARSSATDVRRELEKLKKEKVNGVILDLRNNGGGALDDAVEMAGLFIKTGPVVQVKDKNGKVRVLKDNDPSIVYDGPLVVLINSMSASASEILAAALQDYGRAIIVGGDNSFGKGTVQSMIDLDQLVSGKYEELKPLGSLKLTTQKYYRINGGSVQFKGVHSDIPLPDPTSYLKMGEEHLDYPLPWDTVPAASYQKKKNQQINLNILKQKSAKRVENSSVFSIIKSTINRVKAEQENTEQTLNLYKAWQAQKAIRHETAQLENAQNKKPLLTVRATTNGEQARTKSWLEQLSKDVYLDETLKILADFAK